MDTSTRWLTFLWSCLKWAFGRWETGKGVLELTGPAIRLILNVIGLTAVITGGALTTWVNRNGVYLLLVPIGLYAFIAGIVAPYALWKQERQRAVRAEATLQPGFAVAAVMRSSKEGKLGCIQVENQQSGALVNCVGILRGVYHLTEGTRVYEDDIPPFYFRWADRFQSEENSPKLTINGVAELEVARIAAGVSDYHIRLLSFHPEKLIAAQMRSKDLYLPERNCYLFDIEIRPENASPVRCLFRLTVPQYPTERGQVLPGGGRSFGPQPEWTFEMEDTRT